MPFNGDIYNREKVKLRKINAATESRLDFDDSQLIIFSLHSGFSKDFNELFFMYTRVVR